MKATPPPPATFKPGRHLEILDEPRHDPYQAREKLAEPSVCSVCGAVFHEGRWQWLPRPAHAQQARCPACWRTEDKLPAGYVTIEGPFARAHRDEVRNLVQHLEAHKKAEHPLQRIMAIDEQDDALVITTTDIHLARGIGEALEAAYKGELDFHYNKDEYLLRVSWRR